MFLVLKNMSRLHYIAPKAALGFLDVLLDTFLH